MTMIVALPDGPARLAGLTPFAIVGDLMQPQLNRGDFLMLAPATSYSGEGVYVLDFHGDGVGSPYMASRVAVRGASEVRIWHPNPLYSKHVIGLDDFERAVRGKAVADVHMYVPIHEIERIAA